MLESVKKGQKLWTRIDGQKDRQRKMAQALQKESLNLEEILAKVASWDPATAKGAEAALILILFDKERGAGFKRPKKK